MSDFPTDHESDDDIDERYRRASALDAGAPSESVRRSVLAHAAQLAAGRSARQPAANQAWRRPAVFGTLAAAALAGLLITPHFLAPPEPAPAPSAAKSMRAEAPPVPQVPTRAPIPPAPAPAYAEAARAPARSADSRAVGGLEQEIDSTAASPVAGAVTAANAPRALARQAPASMATLARAPDQGAMLRQAAQDGDVAGLQSLLAGPIDVNARDAGGRTALMLATLHGQAGAVDALLAHRADPNLPDARGTTPLQAALDGNQPAIATALQRAGAR